MVRETRARSMAMAEIEYTGDTLLVIEVDDPAATTALVNRSTQH